MTIKRVKQAAYIRGMYFSGEKKWRNTMVGYAYELNVPTGKFVQADTLEGIYKVIMEYPIVRK